MNNFVTRNTAKALLRSIRWTAKADRLPEVVASGAIPLWVLVAAWLELNVLQAIALCLFGTAGLFVVACLTIGLCRGLAVHIVGK